MSSQSRNTWFERLSSLRLTSLRMSMNSLAALRSLPRGHVCQRAGTHFSTRQVSGPENIQVSNSAALTMKMPWPLSVVLACHFFFLPPPPEESPCLRFPILQACKL